MKINEIITESSVHFGGKPTTSSKMYMRSLPEIKNVIQDKLNTSADPILVEHIAKLYANYRILPSDDIELHLLVSDLDKYKEYSREVVDGWTGKMSGYEYDELMADIKSKGITSCGVLNMIRDSDTGETEVYLGEGNHRLSIAKKLGIRTMPVRIAGFQR